MTQKQQANANLIISAFAKARYGVLQQAAAVANAMGESTLNASRHNSQGEDSWGLFQLNRQGGGVGAGIDPTVLINPVENIRIVLQHLSGIPTFKAARTLSEAVSVFVIKLENPKRPQIDIAIRLQFAHKLLPQAYIG